jgi:transcription-repair coupling factor (superfamily II helicase)
VRCPYNTMKSQLAKSQALQQTLESVKGRARSTFIGGVADCLRGIVYSYLASELENDVFIITSSDNCFRLYSELAGLKDAFLIKGEVLFYPEDDSIIYNTIQASKETSRIRAKVYEQAFKTGRKIIITDINAAMEKIPSSEKVRKFRLALTIGKTLDINKISEVLNENKYNRVLKVEDVFEYSVRGSIIDIFSPDYDYPVRIELFGDEIESLRFFSLETYSTTKNLESAELLLFNPGGKFRDETASILDYFPAKDTVLIIDDVDAVKADMLEKMEKIGKYLQEGDAGRNMFTLREIFKKIAGYRKIRTYSTGRRAGPTLKTKANPHFKRDTNILFEYLRDLVETGYNTCIISDNEAEETHLKDIIGEYAKKQDIPLLAGIEFLSAESGEGCVMPDIKLCIISNREIFERYKGNVAARKEKKFLRPVRHFTELKEKDYIVHREHGIGVFEGIRTLEADSRESDFILIRYAGDDKLYLPIDRIDMIDKYVGSERLPALSKLGTGAWRKTKAEIALELKQIASELLEIYAKREMTKGISYQRDDSAQTEFENAFIYEETPDQDRAIDDVKRDMESVKQMDRLVCGDAGFGKTEVALRAAFKAVNFGKQAFLLTTTTLLAQQHFNTFRDRLADYPIRVEMLSRLVKPGKRKSVIEDLKTGKVDVLIGTHAALNDKIEFSDLGLVVVDEEQHLGAKKKEYLRKKHAQADILTLTATPIPRTLYFSLAGIRDISIINTPPPGKKPIEVYIITERLNAVKEIILREILRRGQVFYVHNNIKTIHQVHETFSKALPEVRFKTAHGRMEKSALERIMADFLAKKFDVLITTTIIEAGLDMPDVNTIMISNAERFGLSQLYQLKGRVGRRDRQAYAYLMVKDPVMLTDTAKERLRAIESYVDPGAGFEIAMKDLEIRGAGHVLGTKQHGNMEKVGFEMYCSMLEDAVAKLKGGEEAGDTNTQIKTMLQAYIPADYIWDTGEKLRIYRKLFLVNELVEIREMEKNLKDVWGEPPQEVRNILLVGALKATGKRIKAEDITYYGGRVDITWDEMHVKERDRLKKEFDKKGIKYKAPGRLLAFDAKTGEELMRILEQL